MSTRHYTRTIDGDTITLHLYEGDRVLKEVAATANTTLIASTAAQWQDQGAAPGKTIFVESDRGGRARRGETS